MGGGANIDNECTRGVAQLLLLSATGGGKTTMLRMLPRLLSKWLRKGDEPCLVRLLFAASPSLDGAPYCHFVRTLDAHVRERLTIPDVLEFLRMALEVPADEYLLLVPLINKAHRTNGSFGQKKTGKEVTWYHQLTSEITREMNEVAGSGRTFILPVTAATQYRQVDMTHMPELRRSLDAQLDLPLLTAEQKEAAVMGLARKVAAANGRTAPATIPAAVTKLLGFAGSTPGELTYVMEGFGDYWWREDDGWRKDFDQRLTMIQSYQMLAVLEQVRDRGLSGTCWDVLCGSKDYGVRRDCYLKLLGQTLTDAPVRRSDKVLGTGTRPTFGGASVVYCETDDEDEQLQSFPGGSLSCLASATAPSVHQPAVRLSVSPLVAAEMLRELRRVDYTYSGIIGTLMTQDTATEGSVAQMWVMKMEGYGVQGRTTVRLQELMQGVALPETIPDIACIVPQGRLALSDVSMLPEKPPLLSDPVVIGAVELGSQGDLSMFVLLDEQEQPWTFFIRTQQADESTATTVKHVVCSLEDDLSEYIALPQISPVAWTNWHPGLDNVPTVEARGQRGGLKTSGCMERISAILIYKPS
ncbi:g7961 [Coccomyxa viridis]|uniref:G7961 protein n=1 Tax=Coccomyxa viridis TaxID=1274662 RepID=A0ABP1G392_9CHLO